MTHFTTHNQNPEIDAYMTFKVGEATLPFTALQKCLGEPIRHLHDKVKAEWLIQFDDGEVATVYDWKEPHAPQNNEHWCIGGHRGSVVARISAILSV